jgi:hypothetical protein
MGSDTIFWPLDALDVLVGYDGRGGAEPLPLASKYLVSVVGVPVDCLGGDLSRSFSRTAGEGADGAKWDLRLLCSSMLTAQASRSTGVRFAACKKAS